MSRNAQELNFAFCRKYVITTSSGTALLEKCISFPIMTFAVALVLNLILLFFGIVAKVKLYMRSRSPQKSKNHYFTLLFCSGRRVNALDGILQVHFHCEVHCNYAVVLNSNLDDVPILV